MNLDPRFPDSTGKLINEEIPIEDFSFNFSQDQVQHLIKLSGIPSEELKSKLPFIIVLLLNKLLQVKGNLKKELEHIISVRAQFYIPQNKRTSSWANLNSQDKFFNDSYYALSSLLETDPDTFIVYIANNVNLDRGELQKLFGYLAPHFLNQFAVFLGIEDASFFSDDNKSTEQVEIDNPPYQDEFVTRSNKFFTALAAIFSVVFKALKIFLRCVVISSKYIYRFLRKLKLKRLILPILFLSLLTALILFYFYGRAQKLAELDSALNTNKHVEQTEVSSQDKISVPSRAGLSATETAPLILPVFPKDSTRSKLLSFFESDQRKDSREFKVEGFKFKNKKVVLEDEAFQELFFIARILNLNKKANIIIGKDENNKFLSLPQIQNKFMYHFAKTLAELGVSEERIKVEYLFQPKDLPALNAESSEDNGAIGFKVVP